MESDPHAALIHASLEQAAARSDDITPAVYARYFATHPEALPLFGDDADNALKGDMLARLIQQIMDFAEGRSDPDLIVSWASDHIGYGVPLAMFPGMFASIKQAMREVAADAWNEAVDAAWEAQFAGLLALIGTAYQRFGSGKAV